MGKIYGCKVTDLVKNIGYELTQKLEFITDYTDMYLTGSRFFGTETEKSDWDFIVKIPIASNSYKITDLVKSLGFKKQEMKEYKDLLIADVYTLEEGDMKIDLQFLVGDHNVETKLKVQSFMEKHYKDFEPIMAQKELRSTFWNALIMMNRQPPFL